MHVWVGCYQVKAGIVNVHLGGGTRKLELLKKVVEETEIPISQFYQPMRIAHRNYLMHVLNLLKMAVLSISLQSEDPDFWEKQMEKSVLVKH